MNDYLLQFLYDTKSRFTPFLDWIFELKNPQVLKADILAGITVALVLIPQSMAYAQLAGLPPQMGLYAAFLVCRLLRRCLVLLGNYKMAPLRLFL